MAVLLKKGMYVSFPVSIDTNAAMLYGKIEAISDDLADIKLFDFTNDSIYWKLYGNSIKVDTRFVKHVPARFDISVSVAPSVYGTLLSTPVVLDKEGYYSYFVEYYDYNLSIFISKRVSEKELGIQMTDAVTPVLDSLYSGEFSSPEDYYSRHIICESCGMMRTAPKGFNSILGARANLYPHQIDTIVRAFEDTPCQLMLADEVGLGKTIEACAIIKGLQSRNKNIRVLIIVPDQLTAQWHDELRYRFSIKAKMCMPLKPINERGIYITSFKEVRECRNPELFQHFDLDLCVVDEAHKAKPGFRLYSNLKTIIHCAKSRLILTATPVSKENEDYKKLLTLLMPERFEDVDTEEFIKLAKEERQIRGIVQEMVRDLPDYGEFDLTYSYIEYLTKLKNLKKDDKINSTITLLKKAISIEEKVEAVKSIMAYISQNYRTDSNVIRHRRELLSDKFAERMVEEIVYEPAGAVEGFYEQECFNHLNNKLREVFRRDRNPKVIELCKILFQLTASSPYAVLSLLRSENNRRAVESDEYLSHYFDAVRKWKMAFDKEIDNISSLKYNPDKFHSKLAEIIKWIDANDSRKKYLIFSEYPETIQKYAEAFKKYYGTEAVQLFLEKMSASDMKQAVKHFQTSKECRFVLCDRSGGIGRNFQMADYIVHCELPWAPAILEQRIGRLDRIGRNQDKPVISVVVHADFGTEADLFELYNDGLNEFNHSLGGMEITFDSIENEINSAFVNDPKNGIRDIIPTIKKLAQSTNEEIEDEVYYEQTRMQGADETMQLSRLKEYFDSSNDTALTDAIISWAKHVGLGCTLKTSGMKADTIRISQNPGNRNTMKFYGYCPPFEQDIVEGTFSRDAAVKLETISFFGPGTRMFNSLAENANRSRFGSVSAININDVGTKWEGISFTWDIYYDYSKISENLIPSDTLSMLNRFLGAGQVETFINLSDFSVCNDSKVISAFYDGMNSEKCSKLTKMNLKKLTSESVYIEDNWKDVVEKAYSSAKRAAVAQANEILDIDNAKSFLEQIYDTRKAKESVQFKKSTYVNLFLYAMQNPVFNLSSATYIKID